MIEVRNLSVTYDRASALDNANFRAEAGAVTAIIGPNGAGKSSLLSAIFGSTPSTGTVHLDGKDVSSLNSRQRLRSGLAFVPQGRQLFSRLTVKEYLEIGARLLGERNTVVDGAYDRFPILKTRSRQLAGVLSGGEQQMLVLARALLTTPSVLLLDEMSTGLSPKLAGELLDTVSRLAGEGVTVLAAEPALQRIKRITEGGHVIMRGVLSGHHDDVDELDRNYRRAMGALEEAL